MKNVAIQLFVIVSLLLVSCSKGPDNKVYATKVEKGDWVVTTPGTNPVQLDETYVQIAPTWGQSFQMAKSRADHNPYKVLGSLLLLCFVVVLIGKTTSANWLPSYLHNGVFGPIVLAVLFAFGVYALTNHAIGIKNNNYKWVKKELYDKSIKEVGSTQPIWDSLQSNCLIVDGPYNCLEK